MIHCLKTDRFGESSCHEAECCPEIGRFVCTNECIKAVSELYENERQLRIEAENKLRKYRDAFQPFIELCRKCVKIADEWDEEESK